MQLCLVFLLKFELGVQRIHACGVLMFLVLKSFFILNTPFLVPKA